MPREVVTQQDIRRLSGIGRSAGLAGGLRSAAAAPAQAPEARPDTYQDRLLKYIPAEVVATYVFLDGVARTGNNGAGAPSLRWFIFLILLLGTWFYLERVQQVRKVQQLIISTIAFAVWVLSLGGPFTSLGWYSPVYGAVLLPLYTFAVPVIEANR